MRTLEAAGFIEIQPRPDVFIVQVAQLGGQKLGLPEAGAVEYAIHPPFRPGVALSPPPVGRIRDAAQNAAARSRGLLARLRH